jgi:DNA polymerase beta
MTLEPNNILRVLSRMDYKNIIQKEFDTLRLADLSAGRKFQAIAYSKFLAKLKAVPFVRSFEDVAEVAGKGKIAEKVREIIDTGALGAATRAREETNVGAYEELLGVYGVGPVKARAFVESGIGGIADLRAAVAAGRVELTAAQMLGMEHYEDILERIPREEMDQHKEVIEDLADPVLTDISIVGSYRRGAESSGDIDVLITMPSSLSAAQIAEHFGEYVDRMIEAGYITGVLAQGPTKCLAICQLPEGKARRLDLLMIPRNQYAYALLYFTGSDQFNVAMRRWALEKGYTMNEHGMKATKEGIEEPAVMRKEQDIFRFLGLKYIIPTERKDGGQIVAAGKPVKLVLKKKT